MNVHKNTRSCPASRALLVKRVCEQGWSVRAASEAVGLSDRRGREWMRRADAGESLNDRGSRPDSVRMLDPAKHERILELQRGQLTLRQIANSAGVGVPTAATASQPP